MVQPRFLERRPRPGNPRAARAATHRRIVHKSRARYSGILRVSAVFGCIMLLLMSYVLLTSNLTGLSYAVAEAGSQREALQEETMRLDDRIAALRSDDRLSKLAARMGMRPPEHFALVRVRAPEVAQRSSHFAVFSSLVGLFAPAAAHRR